MRVGLWPLIRPTLSSNSVVLYALILCIISYRFCSIILFIVLLYLLILSYYVRSMIQVKLKYFVMRCTLTRVCFSIKLFLKEGVAICDNLFTDKELSHTLRRASKLRTNATRYNFLYFRNIWRMKWRAMIFRFLHVSTKYVP